MYQLVDRFALPEMTLYANVIQVSVYFCIFSCQMYVMWLHNVCCKRHWIIHMWWFFGIFQYLLFVHVYDMYDFCRPTHCHMKMLTMPAQNAACWVHC